MKNIITIIICIIVCICFLGGIGILIYQGIDNSNYYTAKVIDVQDKMIKVEAGQRRRPYNI